MRVAALIAGLLLATSAWAEIGSVTESSGTAIIKRGKDTIQIVKGTEIKTNDRVETKNGKVKIVFKDDTNVTVTESSSLVIDDFVYDPKSGTGKLGLKAAAGTVRYVSGNIAKDPKNVKINTPTAAIAVRGTDFVMAVSETGASMIMLMPTCEIEQNINLKGLSCGSGAIDVETPSGIVQLTRPYQATLVETLNCVTSPAVIVALNGNSVIVTILSCVLPHSGLNWRNVNTVNWGSNNFLDSGHFFGLYRLTKGNNVTTLLHKTEESAVSYHYYKRYHIHKI
jgi:hypothetical protein